MKLELRGITKRFGSLVANDHIDLTVEPGEIRALLGENGAGKTTLMNVLYGLMQPDEGEILVDGKPVSIRSPKDAIAARIGMVHQHFMLVPVFTVAENVTLGQERTRRARPARPAAGPPGGAGRSPSVTACDVDPDAWSRTSRSACSSGSRSSRRCCARPACSSSTSPPRCSPRARPRTCSGSCASSGRAAGRSCSSRTSSGRSRRSPTRSRSSGAARSSASARRPRRTPSSPR